MLVGGPDSPPQWKGRLDPVMQLFVEILRPVVFIFAAYFYS